jgi:hypothetical protein
MAELVANCPRCGAKSITFDVKELNLVGREDGWDGTSRGWLKIYEAFAVCRACGRVHDVCYQRKNRSRHYSV